MRSHLVLVFGLLLSSCRPIEAQTLATQVFLVQARSEPTTMLVRAAPTYFLPRVSLTIFLPRVPVEPFTNISAYKPDIQHSTCHHSGGMDQPWQISPLPQFGPFKLTLGAALSPFPHPNRLSWPN